jgi:hypothetical protein
MDDSVVTINVVQSQPPSLVLVHLKEEESNQINYNRRSLMFSFVRLRPCLYGGRRCICTQNEHATATYVRTACARTD